MISDITLGQFYPVDSFIHKLDAEIKIILTLLFMVAIFFVQGYIGFTIIFIYILITVKASKIPFLFLIKGIKPILFFIVFTVILNMFMTDGEKAFTFIIWDVTYEGIFASVFMALRIIFLVIGSSLLTYTTSPIMLTDGIEKLLKPFVKIGVPAYELAMMMSIALRFIPTLIEETDKIIKAQKARGSDFETGGLIKRGKAIIPILVPLFVSAFRRADELAMAMEARCYNGGVSRTRLRESRPGVYDVYAVIIFALFMSLSIAIGYTNYEFKGF
ncbi:MAG: energy-coupling factor transporter transmembrane protein EcfT [Ruminococcaceae bacterium]|nr:energy-coupling factor transporter transmembrane protein EcfT [Oscillospiraceae bacterium]